MKDPHLLLLANEDLCDMIPYFRMNDLIVFLKGLYVVCVRAVDHRWSQVVADGRRWSFANEHQEIPALSYSFKSFKRIK